ncbi:hypothetical protein R1sor_010232 [Riccia sorocarpa]|uniref:CCHC-type domain-containing protein n=1 Tax=Riccia sorocarpa TaxID=122646 RepID=A0ABD3HYZ3_9MARC
MTELTVQMAAPKEKRRDANAMRQELWCSTCHNQEHTKEDCRLPKPHTTANSHWVEESSGHSTDDYNAERADGHVYHVSMSGPPTNAPRFAPNRYNPPEYVGSRPRQPGFPTMTKMFGPVPLSDVTCYNCQKKGHYANDCPNPRQQQGYIPLCQNCHEPRHTSPQCPKPVIPCPKVQFVDVPSTSGTKNTADINVQMVGWDVLSTISEESSAMEASTSASQSTVSFDFRSLNVAVSESEEWPSESEWMVNSVTTRSKKKEESPPEDPPEPKTTKLSRRQKKARKKAEAKALAESSTSETPVEAKTAPRNLYKDDISDLIARVLKGKALADAPPLVAKSAESEPLKPTTTVKPVDVAPTPELPKVTNAGGSSSTRRRRSEYREGPIVYHGETPLEDFW